MADKQNDDSCKDRLQLISFHRVLPVRLMHQVKHMDDRKRHGDKQDNNRPADMVHESG